MVIPTINQWHHDSPAVCPWQSATTWVAAHAMAARSHFYTKQCSAEHGKNVIRLSQHSYYPSLAYPIPRFASKVAYLSSFGTASWASHEFEQSRGNVTANMERNFSRHHTKLVYLNA
ncbi:transposable element Tcb1 transposase [Trichonephila clavipes]|nr:transposable element Tcb1 transposase [Trichonephila clavipes]